MIKTAVSTILLAILLQGCNSSKESNEGDLKEKVSDEIKGFAKLLSSNKSSKIVQSGLSSSESKSSIRNNKFVEKTTIDSCVDGGTKEIVSDIDLDNITQMTLSAITVDVVVDSCIEYGVKSSGAMTMVIKGLLTTITFTQDSLFEELEGGEIVTIFKGSSIKIEEISDSIEEITESTKIETNRGEKFETISLVTTETQKGEDLHSYDSSGSLIYEGVTYRVDKNYDASKTPMVVKNYEKLVSGTAKYYNEENQHITVKVLDKNRIKISVDSDNDGDIDEEEIFDL